MLTKITYFRKAYISVFLFTVLNIFSIIATEQARNGSSAADNNIFVVFDPYVSILDKYNKSRYSVDDLLPLIKTVATEFSGLIVDYGVDDLYHKKSNSRKISPLAIATYNSRKADPTSKLEVWLTYSVSLDSTAYAFYIARELEYIANEANKIFNNTVTTILFSYHLIYNRKEEIRPAPGVCTTSSTFFEKPYKLGFIIDSSWCGKKYRKQANYLTDWWAPDVVMINFSLADSQSFSQLCHEYISSPCRLPQKVAYLLRDSDTNENGHVNVSRFVKNWNTWRRMVHSGNATVVLSKAFDTPYESSVQRKTEGWWRLVESTHDEYVSPANFTFERKMNKMNKFTLNEQIVSDILKETGGSKLNKNFTGIIYDFYEDERMKKAPVFQNLNEVVKTVQSNFGKIAILVDFDSDEGIYAKTDFVIDKLATSEMEIIALILTDVPIADVGWFSTYRSYSDISTHLLKYETHRELGNDIYYLHTQKKVGYVFDISTCLTFSEFAISEQRKMATAFNQSNIVIFSFEEDSATVKLGAERMFEQRRATFEQCRHVVVNALNSVNSKRKIELGFVMLHYAHSPDVYDNVQAMYDFVLYWKLLTEWAGSTKTTVIMSNLIDSIRVFKNDVRYDELGWWSPHVKSKENGSYHIELLDKKANLKKLSDKAFPQQNNSKVKIVKPESILVDILSVNELIVGVIPVIVVIVIVVTLLVFFLSRRYYRNKLLTNKEIRDFIKGAKKNKHSSNTRSPNEECTELQKLPYDKQKYELESASFKIEYGNVLGSGEFGKVYKGMVKVAGGDFVDVAVKTENDAKAHKTALIGILSEIKILAYLDKHENVMELIGASTADLKRGKVFVFLKFCELGSLEKYLRNVNVRSTENAVVPMDNGIEMNAYANIAAMKSNILDPVLSEDMNRWAKEICSGMSFLAVKHVVHADLATRNVLLTANKVAIISDFGLSRRMYNYTNYVKQKQEPLPWKWMAPESLKRMEFSEKSDVWAYGVTLWEVFSLGDIPYAGLSWDPNFPQMLEAGFRMSQPKYNEKNMYAVMKECWKTVPDVRPSFATLLLRFGNASKEEVENVSE